MATGKQIAANRANAKRSTGPKTAAGKQKSSRNAYRHGLSRPEVPDPSTISRVNAIAEMLVTEPATEDRRMSAKEFAIAQVELARIQTIRTEQWAKINPEESLDQNAKELKRLASLDRHESYAFTRRRRASKNLEQGQPRAKLAPRVRTENE
jgi:hypothetical protein